MSVDAWVIATVEHLQTQLVDVVPGGASKAVHFIGWQPDGHPPANMGAFYISVDEDGSQSMEHDKLHEVYAIKVWITKRISHVAPDRKFEAYKETSRGLRDLERRVILAIHNNHTLRAAVNTELGVPHVDVGDACINPMWFKGRPKTQPAGGEWNLTGNDKDAFLVRLLPFAGGRRIQSLDVAG